MSRFISSRTLLVAASTISRVAFSMASRVATRVTSYTAEVASSVAATVSPPPGASHRACTRAAGGSPTRPRHRLPVARASRGYLSSDGARQRPALTPRGTRRTDPAWCSRCRRAPRGDGPSRCGPRCARAHPCEWRRAAARRRGGT